MIMSNILNIQHSQNEYHDLVVHFNKLFCIENPSFKIISKFLDEIKFFWYERLNIIDFELEELTNNDSCFLLCGAIYLNVKEYEHFYFKSIGDYHFLFDPFLKMENFFRVPEEKVNSSKTIEYFKEVFFDTLEILTKYTNFFYILPIRELAVTDEKHHYEMLEKFFMNFVSRAFNHDFADHDDFHNKYGNYEQIESDIDPYIRENLIFLDKNDTSLSLRLKVERYCKEQMSFSELTKGQSESQIFLLALYSWLSQIIDILLICVTLRLNPYIRFDVTFHYLALLMYTFIEDSTLRKMIEKSIIFFIFRKVIENNHFNQREFSEYYSEINNKNILGNLLSKIREQKIDIFKGGIKDIEIIIRNEFGFLGKV